MEIYMMINYLGVYGPIILFFLTIFFLRNMKTYLYFFIIGFGLNNVINIVLKLLIKEPRPSKDQRAIEIGVVNGARISFDKFGMPSGHAQNCAYCLSYITFALNDPTITALYLVLSTISVAQRYLNNNHTLLQLLVGSLIGAGFGYQMYMHTNKLIKGNIGMRKDDNGPL
jgi:membrane-associated phospholipid phosphatase